jgi:hypothetical protein
MPEHKGPMPPTGRAYCILCAAGWKAKAFKLAAERKVDVNADINLSAIMSGQPLPGLAVADGVVVLPVPPGAGQAPGTQMVVTAPLCWTHLIPIEIVDTSLTLASAAAGPFGGAHLLGR